MKNKLLAIPQFKSLQDEADFWDTHNSTDYEWEEVKNVQIAKKVESYYKDAMVISLDKSMLQAIKMEAKNKGIDLSTMGNVLLRERLSQLHAL